MFRIQPALFLILFLFFSIFAISLSSYRPIAHAQTVTVSATVDEHLTFQKSGQQLSVSTNTSHQYILISTDGLPLGHFNGPRETIIDINDGNFILVAEF